MPEVIKECGRADKRTQPITHAQALDAAMALINTTFNNSDRRHSRHTVPAQMDDDDVLIVDYIRQQREAAAPAQPVPERDIETFFQAPSVVLTSKCNCGSDGLTPIYHRPDCPDASPVLTPGISSNTCTDGSDRLSEDDVRKAVKEWNAESEIFGAAPVLPQPSAEPECPSCGSKNPRIGLCPDGWHGIEGFATAERPVLPVPPSDISEARNIIRDLLAIFGEAAKDADCYHDDWAEDVKRAEEFLRASSPAVAPTKDIEHLDELELCESVIKSILANFCDEHKDVLTRTQGPCLLCAAPAVAGRTQGDIGEKYRRLLWLSHGHDPYLYGDDGEMQCNGRYLADFKRQSLVELEAHVLVANVERAALQESALPDPVEVLNQQPFPDDGNGGRESASQHQVDQPI